MNRLLAAGILALTSFASAQTTRPIVLGYVRGPKHLLAADEVSANKLTRIHYAFLVPQDGVLSASAPTDDANLRTLTALRKQNPTLEILVSIGGGANSQGFSDLALTPESRARFIASCMDVLATYGLDGIDIDWEYPGSPSPGHPVRKEEDKNNYTALFHDFRDVFNAYEAKTHHKHLILSTATNGKPFFVRSTDLGAAAKYLDTIALMGYDIYNQNSPTTGHTSPLLTNPADPTPYSDDRFVKDYESIGVPVSKIVLGVPFYGFLWKDVDAKNNGLYQPVIKKTATDVYYKKIVQDDLTPTSGFARFWDDAAKVPYLYNATTKQFISYEDPESLTAKAAYVREHKLGGMMFWEYNGDLNNQLVDAINAGLQPGPVEAKKSSRPRKP